MIMYDISIIIYLHIQTCLSWIAKHRPQVTFCETPSQGPMRPSVPIVPKPKLSHQTWTNGQEVGVSINGGIPKWMVYNGKCQLVPTCLEFPIPTGPTSCHFKAFTYKVAAGCSKVLRSDTLFSTDKTSWAVLLGSSNSSLHPPMSSLCKCRKTVNCKGAKQRKKWLIGKVVPNHQEDHAKVAVSMTKRYFTSDFTARS